MATWQVQQAKSRLSEVLEKAQHEGPQTITKHGVDAAIVLSVEDYRRLKGPKRTLSDLLLSGPKFDDFEPPARETDPPPECSWDGDEKLESTDT